ncbi:DNA cytosine methyltransferase [Deinococcus sp. Leaf326]|uniref:DNA cytosine methyltransferase n=1 Tax=Deinococcus sp. Leaf326 TaxID=1736338 RepID=UPI000A502EA1|nr:DNA cytosine methyltransferase [Deinococcus sp. Leaf326]
MTSRKLVAIDLFAGAGGFGEGLELAGIKVAAALELHPHAGLTYAFNHPDTEVFIGDIRETEFSIVLNSIKKKHHTDEIDLITGGPPCQGFSTAGKKNSEDPRNNLFRQYARAVEFFKPQYFILENVPGFKKMYGGFAYEQSKKLLEDLGYKTKDAILSAPDYGIPQRRNRFFMIGWRKSLAEPSWPSTTHGNHSLFGNGLPIVTIEEALGDIDFLAPGFETHYIPGQAASPYQEGLRHGDLIYNHLATQHREKAVEMFSYIPEGKTISQVPDHLRTGKITMARMDRKSQSNAVLALPDDMIHYKHHRIPTVREMARLQSFSDDYVFLGKRTSGFMERRVDVPQYTQVGNAVPPLMAKAIAVEIAKASEANTKDSRDKKVKNKMLELLRGTSGFSGYTLSKDALEIIKMKSLLGNLLPLPIDAGNGVTPTTYREPIRWSRKSS